MKVNWKVRLKNKAFWVTIIPAVLLLIQVSASIFGFTLNLGDLGNQLLSVVNSVFAIMSVLGIVNDPTTATLNDSARAMTYEEPNAG